MHSRKSMWLFILASHQQLTHRRKDGRVVEVGGERGDQLSVVCILLLVPHSDFKWQLAVISTDQNGGRAAAQELTLVSSAFMWFNLHLSQIKAGVGNVFLRHFYHICWHPLHIPIAISLSCGWFIHLVGEYHCIHLHLKIQCVGVYMGIKSYKIQGISSIKRG